VETAPSCTGAIQSDGPERGSVSRSTSPAYGYTPVLEIPLRVKDVCDARHVRTQ